MIHVLFLTSIVAHVVAASQHLNLTAISAADNISTLECWQLSQPSTVSTDPGTAGSIAQFLGPVTNASITVLPAGFDGGSHRAPAVQFVSRLIPFSFPCVPPTLANADEQYRRYVYYVSGVAHITVPSNDSVFITGGPTGLIIAVDTDDISATGHNTSYPGQTTTQAISIPIAGGVPPNHTVLHSGGCHASETGSPLGG